MSCDCHVSNGDGPIAANKPLNGEDSDGVGFIVDSSSEHLWSTEERTMMLPALSEHLAMTVSKCDILNSARYKGIKSISFGVCVLQIHGVCLFFNFWTVGAPSMLLWLFFELLVAPLGPVWTPCLVIGGTSDHSKRGQRTYSDLRFC